MGPPPQITAVSLPLNVLDEAVTLTASQKTSVTSIQEEFRTAMQAARPPRPEAGADRPDRATMDAARTKVKALDDAASAKIVALLTSDQRTTLTALLQTLQDYRAVGFPPQAAGKLNLTAAQTASIHTIAAKADADTKALLDASKDASDPRAIHEQARTIHDAAQAAAKAVLTDAQKTQLDTLMKEARPPRPEGAPDGMQPPPPPDGAGEGMAPPPPGGPDDGAPPPPPGGPEGPDGF
jgi:hypothetical protein